MTGRVLELLGPSTGGIRRHVAVLGTLLSDEGWTASFAGPPGVLDGVLAPEVAAAHPPAVVDVPGRPSPPALLRAVRQLRALPSVDVIHAHGLKAGWVAVLARPRAPIVLTIHNVVLDEVAGRAVRVLRALERRLIGRVDRVIGASPAIVEQFRDAARPGAISFVLPVSPPAVARRDRREVRAELGAGDDDVLVVVVARLHPQKDLELFVRAWAAVASAHPEARAAVVGEGPQHAELASLIAELGLGGSLRLAGPSPEAIEQLAAADLVALTSRWEAVPLVVAEAVQLGRPVVSTRVGVVEELVGEGGEVVDVGDLAAFTAALERLVASAPLRARAGGISRDRGRLIYGASALVGQVARVYEEVLAR